jgi:hypothetical protein
MNCPGSMRGMFDGAFAFNQNLCPWGSKLLPTCNVENQFHRTSCPRRNVNPDLAAIPPGPFCRTCGMTGVIKDRVEVKSLFAGRDDILLFKLEETVEKGRLVTCELEVPIGDANLYIKFGSAPNVTTVPDCDCASTLLGTYDEDCTTEHPAESDTTAYIAVAAALDSSKMTLYCFINHIDCLQENQLCKQNADCCGTMVCNNETSVNRCTPCSRPKPCDTNNFTVIDTIAKCAPQNKACKKSRFACCRRYTCDKETDQCQK